MRLFRPVYTYLIFSLFSLSCYAIPTQGLVAEYLFEDGNNLGLDSSGNNNHATNSGATQASGIKPGKAAQFDGVDDYIKLPGLAAVIGANKNFSISAWSSKSKEALQGVFSGGYTNSASDAKLLEYLYYDGNVHTSLLKDYGASNGLSIEVKSSPVALNGKEHTTLVYANNELSIYVNGQLLATRSAKSADWSHAYSYFLGARGHKNAPSANFFLQGLIDNVRIYSRALSAAEINQLYTETASVNKAPVAKVDNFSLKDSAGATELDILANDTDEDKASLAVTITNQSGLGGSATVSGQKLSYTPRVGYAGEDWVEYRLTDKQGLTSEVVRVSLTLEIVKATLSRSDLVAEYLFEDANNLGLDSSGNNNHATNSGAIQVSGLKPGKAVQFDGVDDYIKLPDLSSVIKYGKDFSVSLWSRKLKEAYQGVFSGGHADHATNAEVLELLYYQGNVHTTLLKDYGAANGLSLNIKSGARAVGGTEHTVLVYENNSLSVYLNGSLISTQSVQGSDWSHNYPYFLGTSSRKGVAYHAFLYGVVDNVRIYSKAATTSDVAVLFKEEVANAKPVAKADSFSVNDATSTLLDILANDTDEDKNSLVVNIVAKSNDSSQVRLEGQKVRYIAGVNTSGQQWFDYQLTDSKGLKSAVTRVAVTVQNINHAPVAQYETFMAPGTFSYDLLANDYDLDGDKIRGELDPIFAPQKGSYQFDGRIFTFTPRAGASGIDRFGYRAVDEHGAKSKMSLFQFNITAETNTGSQALPDVFHVVKGKENALDVMLNDMDSNKANAKVSIVAKHPQAKIRLVNNYIVHYTPPPGFMGWDSLRYYFTNQHGNKSNEQLVRILVQEDPQAGNPPPVAVPEVYTQMTNNSFSYDVMANDYDPQGEAIRVEFDPAFMPKKGQYQLNGNVVTYTPEGTTAYAEKFGYRVVDARGAKSKLVLFNFTVNASKVTQPIAVDDAATTFQNQGIVIDVMQNDMDDQKNDAKVSIVSQQNAGAQISLINNYIVRYKPAKDFVGVDSFKYRFTDPDGQSAEANVVVIVKTLSDEQKNNKAPVAAGEVYISADGKSFSYPLLANDFDPDGDVIQGQVLPVLAPKHGTYSFDGQVLDYQPKPGFKGIDSFGYVVKDNKGGVSDPVLLTLSLGSQSVGNNQMNPVVDAITIEKNKEIYIDVLSNDVAGQKAQLAVKLVKQQTAGANISFDQQRRVFNYRPKTDFVGIDSFEYQLLSPAGVKSEGVKVWVNVLAQHKQLYTPIRFRLEAVNNGYALKWDKQGEVYQYQLERKTSNKTEVLQVSKEQWELGDISTKVGERYRIRSCDNKNLCSAYSLSLTLAPVPIINDLQFSPKVALVNQSQQLSFKYKDTVKCFADKAKNNWLDHDINYYQGALHTGIYSKSGTHTAEVNRTLTISCLSEDGNHVANASVKHRVLAQKLAAPLGLSVTSQTPGTVQLTWQQVAGAEGYKVEYKRKEASSWSFHANVTTATAIIKELSAGEYLFKVTGCIAEQCDSVSHAAQVAANIQLDTKAWWHPKKVKVGELSVLNWELRGMKTCAATAESKALLTGQDLSATQGSLNKRFYLAGNNIVRWNCKDFLDRPVVKEGILEVQKLAAPGNLHKKQVAN